MQPNNPQETPPTTDTVPAANVPVAPSVMQPTATISQPTSTNSSISSKNIIEILGLVLGVLLFLSVLSGSVGFAQFALFFFAAVGVYTVVKELLNDKKQQATPQPTQYSVASASNVKKPITARSVIKVASIGALAVIVSIFVLPVVGIFALIFMFTIFGGGQNS